MKTLKFIPESSDEATRRALFEMVSAEGVNAPYMDMLKLRIKGGAAEECCDNYYLVTEQGKCLCRLWSGWGRHQGAIGNFGNFHTLEERRGQGIGRRALTLWYEDVTTRPDAPPALFCTSHRVATIYFPYGFRPAVTGTENGPLYLPLGDSPATFRQFCERYYEPAEYLFSRPATLEWRHEIDCLLKFALLEHGRDFGIGKAGSLEEVLLCHGGDARLLFTPNQKCVGWIVGDTAQLYPLYENTKIITERNV